MTENKKKNQLSLHWQAPEFHFYEKNFQWFASVGLILIVLIAIFIILGISQKQLSYYLAAGTVFAAGLALFTQALVKPNPTQFHIDEQGVQSADRAYPWTALKTFWISDNAINFELGKKFSFPLSTPLGQENAEEMRNFLLQFLPEKTNGSNLISERINRLFRF